MATRLWFPATGPPSISPAPDASWGVTAGLDRVRTARAKTGTAIAAKSVAETALTAINVLVRQYISDPLQGQTLSGTIRAMVRVNESTLAADMRAQMVARVVSNDGATVRGTLLAGSTAALAAEWATGRQARKFPLAYSVGGAVVASTAVRAGDRIVIELGARAHNLSSTSYSATMEFGDPTAVGDLTETETAQSALCPWVEFSQNLLWDEVGGWVKDMTTGATAWVLGHPETGVVSAVNVTNPAGVTSRVTVRDNVGPEHHEVPPGQTAPVSRARTSRPHALALG